MATIEMPSPATLDGLLELRRTDRGLEEVRALMVRHVKDVDGKHISVLGTSLAEWSAKFSTRDLGGELSRAFSIDPFAMMARAWAQFSKVRKAIDESRGPPPSPAKLVTQNLLKHDIEATATPRLVLSVNGVDWCDVKLEAKLSVSTESAVLKIRDACLMAVDLGGATGSLTFSCQNVEVHSFKHELKFSRSYEFKTPLRISHELA